MPSEAKLGKGAGGREVRCLADRTQVRDGTCTNLLDGFGSESGLR